MIRKLAALAALVAMCSMAMGQTEATPGYSLELVMDKKDANQVWAAVAFFPGRAYADMWTATIKHLLVDHKRILVADKASGFISGEDHIGDVQYFLEERPGGIQLIFPAAGGLKGIEKLARQRCEAILEQAVKGK